MSINGNFAAIQAAIIGHSRSFRSLSSDVVNQNSPGTKRSYTHFKSIVGNNAPGVDFNKQRGFGITPYYRQNVREQGVVLATSYQQDLAIVGEGFFMVKDPLDAEGELFFTRNGNFRPFTQIGGLHDTGGATYLTDSDRYQLQGWMANNFELPGDKTLANLQSINIDLLQRQDPGRTTTEANLDLNLPVSSSVTESFPTYSIDVIDTSGESRQFALTFVPTDTYNVWDIRIEAAAGGIAPRQLIGQQTLSFDSNGNLIGPETLNLTQTWPNGAESNVALNISDFTSYGDEFNAEFFSHNGRAQGNLLDFFYDQEGVITGRYSNGHELILGQIAIADFVNSELLENFNGSKFRLTHQTGDLQLFDLLQTNRANLQAGALEASTIDIADSFSRIIETQHAYTTATKSLQTIDENLETVIRMKR